MEARERDGIEASAKAQLELELDVLYRLFLPAELAISCSEPVNRKVEQILRDQQLTPLLADLDEHNRSERSPRRRKCVIGPCIRVVLSSIEQRNERLQNFPILSEPASAVRQRFEKFSTDCKQLADSIRKSPQPQVKLAPQSRANETLRVLTAWEEWFEASGPISELVPLSALLDRAAEYFKELSNRVPRSARNRRPAMTANSAIAAEFRGIAAEQFLRFLRKRLGRPYRRHVATLTTLVSGCVTDEEFVKKIDTRRVKKGK